MFDVLEWLVTHQLVDFAVIAALIYVGDKLRTICDVLKDVKVDHRNAEKAQVQMAAALDKMTTLIGLLLDQKKP